MTTVPCLQCSVRHVDILCDLYERIGRNGDTEARHQLKRLSAMARQRGYLPADGIMVPGQDMARIRRLCWNMMSVLTERDFQRMGLNQETQ